MLLRNVGILRVHTVSQINAIVQADLHGIAKSIDAVCTQTTQSLRRLELFTEIDALT
jgi:uncharacterized protein (DUF39 family)